MLRSGGKRVKTQQGEEVEMTVEVGNKSNETKVYCGCRLVWQRVGACRIGVF
ncbi:hypothetical protein COLO4_22785 [Corchorus olitorius]|uniref:Uncharacterized protein n=1 Tax=Corchorus olitorius TaxID=93759 RepID=A0A1R3IJZ8_9ROSI|nr:hypothetical protein COLO4_22785 [Corchorus olitorius]